jgi:positive regulator of sigma E activity
MREEGTVSKVRGQLVWVTSEQCAGCRHDERCGACGSSGASGESSAGSGHHEIAIFPVRRQRLIETKNTRCLDLRPGDRVEYFVAPGKAIKAGFLVLIVPILVFFLFHFLVGAIWKHSGETARVLAGVGGITLSFFMSFARRSRIREFPEITRVIRGS